MHIVMSVHHSITVTISLLMGDVFDETSVVEFHTETLVRCMRRTAGTLLTVSEVVTRGNTVGVAIRAVSVTYTLSSVTGPRNHGN